MSNIQRGNEALARIRASKEAARASGSRPAPCSVDWVDCKQNQPPEYEKVLMWYSGTETVTAWAVVDCWHNRVIRKPDYWARINPPNAKLRDAGESGVEQH